MRETVGLDRAGRAGDFGQVDGVVCVVEEDILRGV